MISVKTVPCFSDNYAYLLTSGQDLILIDPCEFSPIHEAILESELKLKAIFITHNHHDHITGLNELIARHHPQCIVAHQSLQKSIPQINYPVQDDQIFQMYDLTFQVINTSGHTECDISFLCEDHLFVGDSLFSAGCGRVISGNTNMLYHSLNTKISRLNKDTKVFFGHEYTLNNLKFALYVEPENQAIQKQYQIAQQKLKSYQFTTPTTIAQELQINPFLRCDSREIQRNLKSETAQLVEIFSKLRKLKNNF